VAKESKTCVIVGVGPGLGLGLARRFGAEGYTLGLIARNGARLEDYVSALELDGYTACPVVADVAKPAQLRSALRDLEKSLGPAGVLIYNAFSSGGSKPSELTTEDLEATLQVNLTSGLIAAQMVIPDMKSRQKGTLLFTGEGLALRPSVQQAALSIGKAGLRAFVGSLSQELAPEGIHVATVTIRGQIKAGTAFDPDLIAEVFWQLHAEPKERWHAEIVFDGMAKTA